VLQQHISHMTSTYTTVLQHLAEIRQVASGKSPGGARLAPLPRPEMERLSASLDDLRARLERVLRALVPDLERAVGDSGDVAATRMWVNILLRTVEELVADLLPARMQRRYGAIGRAEAQRLHADIEDVLSVIRGLHLPSASTRAAL